MTLCITIAQPRPLAIARRGLARLARYLFLARSLGLREQIAPVGERPAMRGSSVVICMMARDGMLHLFANDAWMTAANNSGGLEMAIERLPARSDSR